MQKVRFYERTQDQAHLMIRNSPENRYFDVPAFKKLDTSSK